MSLTRFVAVLLIVGALLCPAGVASASMSKLTQQMPSAPTPRTAPTLARTGFDVPLELGLGTVLVAIGMTLRLRRAADRA